MNLCANLSHYASTRSNIHDTIIALKDMEPKFWCFKHTRFDIKDMVVCETHLHVAME